MTPDEIRAASSMPLSSPSYPKGPYRFIDREYLLIHYESDPEAIRAMLPEPLEPDGNHAFFDGNYLVVTLPKQTLPTWSEVGLQDTSILGMRVTYDKSSTF